MRAPAGASRIQPQSAQSFAELCKGLVLALQSRGHICCVIPLLPDMLRKGASMTEIGEILRHRSPNSTEIYAKVDIEGLRSHCPALAGERRCELSNLREAMQQYLALRRSLGFQLLKVDSTLRSFVAFAEIEAVSHITVDLALRWVKLSTAKESATLADRLNIVRRFAIWRSAVNRRTEVPPRTFCLIVTIANRHIFTVMKRSSDLSWWHVNCLHQRS